MKRARRNTRGWCAARWPPVSCGRDLHQLLAAQNVRARPKLGLERCILPPLERPTPEQAVVEAMESGEEASSLTSGTEAAEHPAQDDSEDVKISAGCEDTAISDTTSSSNIVNSRPYRRGSGGDPKTGGIPRGVSFRRGRYSTKKIDGTMTGRPDAEVEASGAATRANDSNARVSCRARRRRSSAVVGVGAGAGGGQSGGCASDRSKPNGRVTAIALPSWSASNLSASSLDADFASSPLLAALSSARGLYPATCTNGGGVKISGPGGDRGRGSDNRSVVPALAADASSLRTRRSLEEREASCERRKLLKSLGVGTRRTLERSPPGKREAMQLVTVDARSPGSPTSPGPGAMAILVTPRSLKT